MATKATTTIQVVKIKKNKQSKWENAIYLYYEGVGIPTSDNIRSFIYDTDGNEVNGYYDIKYTEKNKPIEIPNFKLKI